MKNCHRESTTQSDLTNSLPDGPEQRIVAAAKKVFLQHGFVASNLSAIAEQAGISRTLVHYYFHNKEQLFQAVLGDILLPLLPQLRTVMQDTQRPLGQRLSLVVDCYYKVLREQPSLPRFIVQEQERDAGQLFSALQSLGVQDYFMSLAESLKAEMRQGKLREVPFVFVFYTFYGLLLMPFLTQKLSTSALFAPEQSFEELLENWKPYIVCRMEELLLPRDSDSTKKLSS